MAGGPPSPGLAPERLVPAGVGINDRDMAEAFARRVYLARVIGGVHEVVEIRDAPGGHGDQGDGGLGVVDRYAHLARDSIQNATARITGNMGASVIRSGRQ